MFEKVNPCHPDKLADRIAGAIVDLAYSRERNPKIAVEVLLGHRGITLIVESNQKFTTEELDNIVVRIAGVGVLPELTICCMPQDIYLASNQADQIHCGDNGIFKGMPVTDEQKALTEIAKNIYAKYPTDGKYILDVENNKLILCQSNVLSDELRKYYPTAIINPLGHWTGGPDVDSGATNRKLGSDMGDAVTGGGLHGKDLSKADVSVNIYCHLKAQETGKPYSVCCAIGDDTVDGKPYSEIVEIARNYIKEIGGFEKFAEWGLIR